MRRGLPIETDLERDPHSLYEGIEYQQFWSGTQKQNLDKLEHALVCRLLPPSGKRIVDVGCGYGRLADCYLDRFQQVVMVDGSMSLLRQAVETTSGRAVYVACDIRRMPFRKASFDAALMIRVFHHITDSRACLSELHRLLCTDGQLVFNYCNKQNALRIARWLIGTNPDNPFSTGADSAIATFFSHHPKAIHQMLTGMGFSKMKYYGAGVFDRLPRGMDYLRMRTYLAEQAAPFLAWSKIAPWILCQAKAEERTDLLDQSSVNNLLECPSCGGNLSSSGQGYLCRACSRYYPVDDGIIDLRIQ